ncbi:MAG: formate dehydrogenase subunit gamma [Proteobacteria bacterium]|nr:formate dehydrogenase subunit gamma [Pseudomonadota bacterium]
MRCSLRSLVAAFAVVLALFAVAPAFAQQPSSVNPTASSVQERQLMDALRAGTPGTGTTLHGRITIPDANASNLIQPQGQAWRSVHQGLMHWIGAIAILGMLAVLVLFYLIRGRINIEHGLSGIRILRFSTFERMIHWMVAGCFIILGLSGLNVTVGKILLLPLIGEDAFAAMSQWAKYAHNYLAWPFMLGLACMFLVWIVHNIPSRLDLDWIRRGGGLVGSDHPPARKFNAGQKGIFWAVMIGGAALSVSGIYLLFPFASGGVLAMQFWNIVHGIAGVLLIAVILAHVYIGTVGMEGASEAMTTGEVDLNWAKEHHSLWVAEEVAKGTMHPHAAGQPAE